jgi:tetratricopeptide (TPR) repeat protein
MFKYLLKIGFWIILTFSLYIGVMRLIPIAQGNIIAVNLLKFLATGNSEAYNYVLHCFETGQQSPGTIGTRLLIARVLFRSGDVQQARALIESNLRYPNSPLSWDMLGEIANARGDFELAINAWTTAGNWPVINARWNQAVGVWTTNPVDAREDFYAIVMIANLFGNHDWESEGYRMACATYRIEAKWEFALADCDRALQIMPESHMALAEKGQILILGYEQHVQGLELIRRAYFLSPDNQFYQNLIERFER